MLDPSYLQMVTKSLEEYWYELESKILCEIAERIKENENHLSSTADYLLSQAHAMNVSNDKINKYLSDALNLSSDEVQKIISTSTYMSIQDDNKIFDEAVEQGIMAPYTYDPKIFKTLIEQGIAYTTNEIENICKTTATTARQKLTKALNTAYMEVSTGTYSSDRAVENAIQKLANEDLSWIDYATGTHRRLDTVVRTAVRTGINTTAAKCQEKNLDEIDCNLVETTSHLGARPSHAEWQGEIFYRKTPYKNYRNFYEATGYGTVGGLCGVNCRHSFYPYVEGVSVPTFEKFDSEENNELYELQQQQRYNERKIREWKRKKEIKDTCGYDTSKEKEKIRYWNARNKQLIASDDRLKHNYAREKVHLAKKNGIINLEGLKITGALDPYSKKAALHAEKYYESVRKMKTDYKKIAKNTGYSEELIKKIKKYSFIDEHELVTGRERFYPDYHMAQSWQRLIEGKNIQPHDLLLLEHEMYEMILANNGSSQVEAHNLTNQIYNYTEGCAKYDGLFKKFQKKQ